MKKTKKVLKFCADCIYHDCNLNCMIDRSKVCKDGKCTLMMKYKQCFNKSCINFKYWYNENILDDLLN